MFNIDIFRTHLESARHSIGHAMSSVALGRAIATERELSEAIASLEAARRMVYDDKEGFNDQI